MREHLIGITGASGRIGGGIADDLASTGETLRLLARDPARVRHGGGGDVRRATYRNDADTRQALRGVTTLFMVSATESADRVEQHRAFVDAAVAAGVEHIVYLSFISPSSNAVFTFGRDHWDTEEYIRASGLSYTFLRDNLYAEFVAALVGEDGDIRGPAGAGLIAPVSQHDVIAAASVVLRQPAAHRNAVYRLTGPEAVSLTDAARLLTEITGRSVSYVTETVDEAYQSRAHYDAPAWMVDGWVSMYTAIAAGEFSPVTDDVKNLTGRDPVSLPDAIRRQSNPAHAATASA